MMNNILLTGRNGFIGQELVARLKGKYEIVSVIRNIKEGIDYQGEQLILSDLCKIKIEDVEKYPVDLIVHLAAQVRGKSKSIADNNIQSSRNLFHIAQELRVPVLFLSSANIFFTEELGGYARSKKICEDLLCKIKQNYLIVRIPLVLGEKSLLTRTVRKFYEGFSFFPLFGPQEGRTQPVPASTLVEFLLSRIEKKEYSNEILTVVGKQAYTYKEIIKNVINPDQPVRFIKFPYMLSLSALSRNRS